MIMIRRVIGESMAPSYEPGAVVVGFKPKRPSVGDVVIATYHDIEMIKRVSAVGNQGYFLRGDNAAKSTDSRTYGWFAPGAIKSVVIGSIAR